MQELSGGREGAIFKRGNTVIRPTDPWSSTIHLLLKHIRDEGFTAGPQFISVDSHNEVLSFVEGDTYNYPLLGAIASETALVTAAQLLRAFHDASKSFLNHNPIEKMTWMLPTRAEADVICHGDFTPYNVALTGNSVTGVFDFDTAHPAPRLWDVAFSAYCWAPLKVDAGSELNSIEIQEQRTRQFCDAYGLNGESRIQLVSTVVERLESMVAFMFTEAENGSEKFQKDITEGHHLSYQNDIDYLKQHEQRIGLALVEV
jgi:hypothetical protein